jgi:DNA-binding CsgD family transcriptional regulator
MSFLLFPAFADADTGVSDISFSVCSRVEEGRVVFYPSLEEAFEAAAGISVDNPDEITLLTDIVLDSPLIVAEGKHVRLAVGGDRMIQRGRGNLEYPLFWVSGDHASLSLGRADRGGLIIDGGFLNTPAIEALAPLVAVSGQYSRLIMYDGVTLQNNCNVSGGDGTSSYKNGSGVYIRTDEGNFENQAEFRMKGGIIQGNTNNTQNPVPCGGGVYISGFGVFTMEGGVIQDNTAYRAGGGFHTGSRGSFYKTGGVIYGTDAPAGYQNRAVNGAGDPRFYGHALSVALVDEPMAQLRDGTVGEADVLSYTGSATANGVFGTDEEWGVPAELVRIGFAPLLFAVSGIAAVFAVLAFALVLIKLRRARASSVSNSDNNLSENSFGSLSPREKEIFDMLLTDTAVKGIAFALGLSYSGVNFHIKNIYRKLGIQSRTELLVKYKRTDITAGL